MSKLQLVGLEANVHLLQIGDITVLFSYGTPVGYTAPGTRLGEKAINQFADEQYAPGGSQSTYPTSRHINRYLPDYTLVNHEDVQAVLLPNLTMFGMDGECGKCQWCGKDREGRGKNACKCGEGKM